MMRRERLLRLYPRAWRARYGDEFLATLGPGPLHPQQLIDIVSGAVDAWLSNDVSRTTAPSRGGAGGDRPLLFQALASCERSRMRYTTRDALRSAGIILVASALFSVAAIAARQSGAARAGEILATFSFPAALTLSLPFWLMKGQPWKAQAAIVGGTWVLLAVVAWLGG
jgi:hypothetical protein